MIVGHDLMWRLACCSLLFFSFSVKAIFNAYRMRQDENIKRPISGSFKVLRSEGSCVLFLVSVYFGAWRGDMAVLRRV